MNKTATKVGKIVINIKNIIHKNVYIQKSASNNTAASTNITINICFRGLGHRRESPNKRPPENPSPIVVVISILQLLCSLSCAELGDEACALCSTLLKILKLFL